MCKWIINYRLLSAILFTQMFRRRVSEQKGRIPLCGVILTINSSPQHKLFPVSASRLAGSCSLPGCFSHPTHDPSAFLHPSARFRGVCTKGNRKLQLLLPGFEGNFWKWGVFPFICERQTLVWQSGLISAMQSGALMLPSASDIQQGSIYLFKTLLQIKTDNTAESQVMPIMNNNHLSLKISPSRLVGLFDFDWTGPHFWLLVALCMAHFL